MTYIENVFICMASPLLIAALCMGRRQAKFFLCCLAGMGEENLKNRKMATETESYPLAQLFAFLNPKDNTICYQKKWYIIGENTIENIYPAKYRHPWMDHPENKASAITEVQRLTDILKGYEASLEAARKEQEWLNNQK